ncbi:ABC transporter substrate-binding protein [Reinekea sp. G2M2-21]|uniref:ABC transporter substrate-binding protein n=1 Tax=Reinekea sp. G2M2-21 TaxID=2788942 RepID=UPI0018AA2E23|nr:ABC transporter substrate-binding protein [Reinekea sp. G2M2-21]
MKLVPAVWLSVFLMVPSLLSAAPITLLHSWQTPSEKKALEVLEKDLLKSELSPHYEIPTHDQMKDAASIKALASSLAQGPTFLALNNEALRHWYDLRLVHSLTPVAQAQGWADIFPPVVMDTVTHRGQIIAAPMSVHTSNWVWANKQLVDATGLALDNSWANFIALLEALQAQGVTPIAHDGSQTQDILLFETLYLAMFGAEPYVQLFDDLNATALRKAEPDFEAVFQRLQTMKPYIKRAPAGTLWHESAQLLMDAEVGLLIQGDWVHGEFARKGRIANQHYYCTEFPGEHQSVAIKVESIASLNSTALPMGPDQTSFFQTITNKDTQFLFNNYKGGLPAYSGTGLAAVSECLTFAAQRTQQAQDNGSLVPSLSQGMAVREVIKDEIGAVITEFMTTELAPAEAANQLQKRMKYASYLIN